MWRGFLIVILILSEGNGALGICLRETMGKPMGLHPLKIEEDVRVDRL
jgi:hypothetical protein